MNILESQCFYMAGGERVAPKHKRRVDEDANVD